MGDIADAMLDGTLCEGCGTYMGEGDGYPVRCEGCGGGGDEENYLPPVQGIGQKQKRKSNLKWSTELLDEMGVDYDSHNNGIHLVVRCEDRTADFWPSTGKYILRDPYRNIRGRGVHNMLADVLELEPANDAAKSHYRSRQ